MDHPGVVDGSSVVRFARSGFAVGAGMLLTPTVIATCAHVIAEAAGLDDVPDSPPTSAFPVELPLAPGRPARTATVLRWAPPAPDGSGDVALLRLDEPVDIPIPPVRRDRQGWGKTFRSVGFPPDREEGAWASGEFRARQASGWLQLVATGTEFVGPGFSGAPVWDLERNAVVAMAVAADLSGDGGAYALPIDQVLAAAPELVANPYQGVAPFGVDDAEFFFGRDREIASGITSLIDRGLLVLAGGSGSGKSSLLAAGIVPAARRLGRDERPVRLAAADSPEAVVAAFATALDAGLPDGAPWVPRLAHVIDTPRSAVGSVDGADLLLVVDQLEELGPLGTAVELIVALAGAGVWIATTARWATFDDLPGSAALAELQRSALAVTQLGPADLRSAVAEPAARVPGASFDAVVVDTVVEDARDEPGRLPLVAALLTQLWASARSGRITLADYRELGGVEGALVTGAEQAWQSLGETDQAAAQGALIAMATATEGGFVRRAAPVAEMGAGRREAIDRLAAARLVTIGPGPSGEVAELAHQALIDRWPRLRGWLVEDADFLRWRTQLRADVGRWTQAPGPALLLRGPELEAAQGWVRQHGGELEPAEREFIAASEQRHRRDRRLRYGAVAAVVALALVASVLTIVVSRTNGSLRTALAAANARSLAQLSRARLASDPQTAVQLALAADAADPDDADARSALGQAYLTRRSTSSVVALPDGSGPPERGLTVDEDPSTDVAVVGTAESALLVDGLATGHPTFTPVPGVTARVRPLTVAGRGRFVVLFDPDGTMQVWDRTRPGPPRALPGPLTGATTTPDGFHLVISSSVPGGSLTQLVDLESGTVTPLLALPESSVVVVATADPTRVLVRAKTPQGGGTTVRDVRTGAVLAPVSPAAVVADRGRLLVECRQQEGALGRSTLTISDSASGAVVRQVEPAGFSLGCTAGDTMITADGRHVAWLDVGTDRTGNHGVQFLDVVTGQRTSATAPRSSRLAAGDALSPEYTSENLVETPRSTGLLSVHGDRAVLVDGSMLDILAPVSTPAWRGPEAGGQIGAASVGDGGSYGLLEQTGDELARTVVPDTGQVIGRLTRAGAGLRPDEQVYRGYRTDSGYVLAVDGSGGRRLLDFTLPALTPTGVYELDAAGAGGRPEPRETRALALARTADRLVTLSGGVLSWWSTQSHGLQGPPVTLTTDEDEITALDRNNGSVQLGDPAGDTVAYRDTDTITFRTFGRADSTTTTLPLDLGPLSFVAVGDRFATVQQPSTINLYDRSTMRPLAPPAGLPDGSQLLGTDAAGDLVTIVSTGSPALQFWSSTDLRPRGQLELNDTSDQTPISRGTWADDHIGDVDVLPLDADVWRDHLCGTQDRSFTPAEVALLPAGADTTAPCHQD
ncbi:nSTAND1 domain-containing NTPase [Actinomycetospora sp. C-140]